MRRARLAGIVLVALTAGAHAAPPPHTIWRDAIEPHAEEVADLLAKATDLIKRADEPQGGDLVRVDEAGATRARAYRLANAMMRRAHRLAPQNTDVLRELASSADALGLTHDALTALEMAVQIAGVEHVGAGVLAPLGAIYLRLGRVDDAIRVLRVAQGPLVGNDSSQALALVYLANALAARGEMGSAIDVLANATSSGNVTYYANEVTFVSFALAVLYDRDDQPGAAFEVISHLQSQLGTQLAASVQSALAQMRHAPTEDEHYYDALLYEVMGDYSDARMQWAQYAANNDLPYRARALEHLAAIDAFREREKVAP